MKNLVRIGLTTALALSATIAAAVEHKVYIEKRGYFPQTVHVQPGDTIRFVNKSGNWARLYSEDSDDNNWGYNPNDPCKINQSTGQPYYDGAKDGWETGWISNNGELVVDIHSCSETTLRSPEVWRFGGNSRNYRGYISFDPVYLGQ